MRVVSACCDVALRSAVAIECLARKNAAKVALTRRRGEIEARDMQENEASAT